MFPEVAAGKGKAVGYRKVERQERGESLGGRLGHPEAAGVYQRLAGRVLEIIDAADDIGIGSADIGVALGEADAEFLRAVLRLVEQGADRRDGGILKELGRASCRERGCQTV